MAMLETNASFRSSASERNCLEVSKADRAFPRRAWERAGKRGDELAADYEAFPSDSGGYRQS